MAAHAPTAPTALDQALAQMAARSAELARLGLDFRPPPPVPTTCCGRGCSGCVWEGYFSAVAYWLEEADTRCAGRTV